MDPAGVFGLMWETVGGTKVTRPKKATGTNYSTEISENLLAEPEPITPPSILNLGPTFVRPRRRFRVNVHLLYIT